MKSKRVFAWLMVLFMVLSLAVSGSTGVRADSSGLAGDNGVTVTNVTVNPSSGDIANGSTISISVDFEFDNETDYDTNSTIVISKFIGLSVTTSVENQELTNSKGEKIGTWSLASDGTLVIKLDTSLEATQTFLKEQNRAGNVTMNATIDTSGDDTSKTNTVQHTIKIGDTEYTYNVVYGASMIGTQKTAGTATVNDDGTITQTFTVVLTGYNGDATIEGVSDSMLSGSSSDIDTSKTSSITVSTTSDISVASSYSSLDDVAAALNGQTLSTGETVTITYSVTTKSDDYFNQEVNTSNYSNKFTTTYKNNDETDTTPHTSEGTATITVDKPSLTKTGVISDDGKTVTWTITAKNVSGYKLDLSSIKDTYDSSQMTFTKPSSGTVEEYLQNSSNWTTNSDGTMTATVVAELSDAVTSSIASVDVSNTVTGTFKNGDNEVGYTGTGVVGTQAHRVGKEYKGTEGDLLHWQVTIDLTGIDKSELKNIVLNDTTSGTGSSQVIKKVTINGKDVTIFDADQKGVSPYDYNGFNTTYTLYQTNNNSAINLTLYQSGNSDDIAETLYKSYAGGKLILDVYSEATTTSNSGEYVNTATVQVNGESSTDTASEPFQVYNALAKLPSTMGTVVGWNSDKSETSGSEIPFTIYVDLTLLEDVLKDGYSIVINDIPGETSDGDDKFTIDKSTITWGYYASSSGFSWMPTYGSNQSYNYDDGSGTSTSTNIDTILDELKSAVTVSPTASTGTDTDLKYTIKINDYSKLQRIIAAFKSSKMDAVIALSYTATLTDDYIESVQSGDTTSDTISNKATASVEGGDDSVPIQPSSTTTTFIPDDLIEKTGSQVGDSKDVQYEVILNPYMLDLDESSDAITAVDEQGDALVYDLTSIVLYKYTGDDSSAAYASDSDWTEMTAGTDYKIYYDADSNKLTLTIPDETAIKLTYVSSVNAQLKTSDSSNKPETSEVTNSFSLTTSSKTTEVDNTDASSVDTSSMGTVWSDTGTLNLFKFANQGGLKSLNGAVFKMHQYEVSVDSSGKVTYTETTANKFPISFTYGTGFSVSNVPCVNKSGSAKTTKVTGTYNSDTGVYKVSGLPIGYVYAFEEVTPPDGYKLPDNSSTFDGMYKVALYFDNQDISAYEASFESNGITTNTEEVSQLSIENDEGGEMSVKKTFVDAPANMTITQKNAITFTVTYKDEDGNTSNPSLTDEDGNTFATGVFSYKDIGTDGVINFVGLPFGTYTVTETIPSTSDVDGYKVTTTYKVDSGTAKTTAQEATVSSTSNPTVTVTNTYKSSVGNLSVSKTIETAGTATSLPSTASSQEFSVVVTLTDSDGKALSGTATYGDTTFTNGVATVKIKNGKTITFTDIPAGYKYSISESDLTDSQTSAGYSKGTVTDNGTGSIVSTKTSSVSVTNKYTEATAKIYLKKVGESTTTAVKGAVFTVYSDAACSKAVTKLTTGTDGTASYTISGLTNGTYTYYLKETSAPAGYKVDSTTIYRAVITVSGDTATVKYYKGSTGTTAATTTETSTIEYLQASDEEIAVSLKLTKYDSTGSTKSALAGAGFTIYSDAACTKAVSTATTGTDGTLTFTGLAAATTYYIVETTIPNGYSPVTTSSSTTLSDGRVAYKVTTSKAGNVDITDTTEVSNVKLGQLTVTKTFKFVNGIKDTFYVALFDDEAGTVRSKDVDGKTLSAAAISSITGTESGATATATITNIPVITGKTYYVYEVASANSSSRLYTDDTTPVLSATDENGKPYTYSISYDSITVSSFTYSSSAGTNTATASLTNEEETGSIKITKLVENKSDETSIPDAYQNEIFEASVDVKYNGTAVTGADTSDSSQPEGESIIKDGSLYKGKISTKYTIELDNLPIGSVCTVSEILTGGNLEHGYSAYQIKVGDEVVTNDNTSVTVTSNKTNVEVVITNEYTGYKSVEVPLSLTKSLEDAVSEEKVDFSAGDFTFVVLDENGYTPFVTEYVNGNDKNKDETYVSLGSYTYGNSDKFADTENTTTYTYYVYEKVENTTTYNYDTSVYKVTVTLTRYPEASPKYIEAKTTYKKYGSSTKTDPSEAIKENLGTAKADAEIGTEDLEMTFDNTVNSSSLKLTKKITDNTVNGITKSSYKALKFTVYESDEDGAKGDEYGSVTLGKTVTGKLSADDITITSTGDSAAGYTYTVEVENLPAGYYIIEESENKISGYSLDEVTSQIEGSVAIESATSEAAEFAAGEEAEVIYTNTYSDYEADFVKRDSSDDKPVEGASLQILRDGKLVDEWTSGSEKHTVTGLLSGVTYTYHEVSAPDGYTTAEDITFVIAEDGKITVTPSDNYDDDYDVIVLYDDKTVARFAKVAANATSTYLEGATLRVTDSAGNVFAEWETTDTIYEVYGLEIGETYTLSELKAPTGYGLADDITFKIKADGSIDCSSTKTIGDVVVIVMEDELQKSLTVTKKWVDNNDNDGTRPASIQVYLRGNMKLYGTKVTLSAANNWTYTWTDLPAYDSSGKEVEYLVYEVEVSGYKFSATADENSGWLITNTHDDSTVDVSGVKTWDDGNNRDGLRPDSITVNLLRDGTAIDHMTITEADDWSYSWTGLPKYHEGIAYKYTVTEDAVSNYSFSRGSDYDIINTYAPGTTSVSVSKAWVDENDIDGFRTDSIKVQLYADGVAYGDPITLNATNKWTYTWTNLYEKSAGSTIEYTVDEVEVPTGYTKAITGDATKGYTITNTHKHQVIAISGTKTWDDGSDQDGKRPESVTVRLLADGKEVASTTVTEKSNWSYSFTNLSKYSDGKEIKYTVTEDAVEDYTTTVDGYDITNTYKPGKTSVTVTKAWEDFSNQDGRRPESIEVQLYADGEEYGDAIELSDDNNWTYTWSELDEYNSGNKIEYTISEPEVPARYISSVTGSAEKGYIIANNEVYVSVKKVDTGSGEELPGAEIVVYDSEGNVVDKWTSTTEAHIVTGVEPGGTYTLVETVAPDGYGITTSTTFTLDENGNVDSDKTTVKTDDYGNLLVEDDLIEIKISKVDVTTQKELPGAHIQIIDKETGKVVYEFNSTEEPTTVTGKNGLRAGKTYILRETVAPSGYSLTTDTEFYINEYGKLDTTPEKTTAAISNEGVLLVEDALLTTESSVARSTVKTSVATGDKVPVYLVIVILIVAAAGFVLMLALKRRNEEDDK